MKRIILILTLLISQYIICQVSHITKNSDSYTKDIFPYQGVRIMTVDEVHVPNIEENVYLFSKIEANKNPDSLFFQHYKKVNEKWVKAKSVFFEHEGFISVWKSRKAFLDSDNNKSIDALFIFSKHNLDKNQLSIHLILSSNEEFYTITAYKEDEYQQSTYSDNFESLNELIKVDVLKYWTTLDKE